MESLVFNKGGQWSLVKSNKNNPNINDFNSYRNPKLEGTLPKDIGNHGKLMNSGNRRSKPTISKPKMEGVTPTPVNSAAADENPGIKPLA